MCGDSFERLVLGSDLPVVVEFWTETCVPCMAVKPVLERLAQEYADKVLVFTVNVNECLEVVDRCGIRSVPAIMTFKDGEQVGFQSGFKGAERIEELFRDLAS